MFLFLGFCLSVEWVFFKVSDWFRDFFCDIGLCDEMFKVWLVGMYVMWLMFMNRVMFLKIVNIEVIIGYINNYMKIEKINDGYVE